MSENRVMALIETHLRRYSEAEIPDVYKLLHQGAFGPGHLITSKRNAREWLEHEAGLVMPDRMLPMVEQIHPEGAMVRFHVRPYLAYRESIRPLLDAFVQSAQVVVGDPAVLAAWWHVFERGCARGGVLADRFVEREVRLFGKTRADEQWPAVHHSPAYNAAYQPVYRVLTVDHAEALCAKLNAPFEVI